MRSTAMAHLVDSDEELLAQLLAEEGVRVAHESRIHPEPRPEALPLSFAQQRLWFLDQFENGGATYNLPESWLLRGRLDVNAFEQSLQAIVRRHEALRTSFPVVDGTAVQVIHPPESVDFLVLDLSGMSETERCVQMRKHVADNQNWRFDLGSGPVIRSVLLKLAEAEHVWLLNIHHIASDEWSSGLFHRELEAFYRAAVEGTPSGLEPLPIQYADYALWQRQRLSGAELEKQLSYWRQQLANLPAVLELPTDWPRPVAQSKRGAVQAFELDARLTGRLKQLASTEQSTLFMVLLAGFQALLHRHSRQEQLAVGTPIAGRTRAETENVIGCFVNTLVMRGDFSDDPTVGKLLKRTRETALAAYDHQDLPFEQIVEALQPERVLSHHPVFQVFFALQNTATDGLQLPGLTAETVETENTTAKFDLSLVLEETPAGLRGTWEFSTDLFSPATLARWSRHFETLLEDMLAYPQRRVSELKILPELERRQIVEDWSGAAPTPLPEKFLHRLFEAQVARTPDTVAQEHQGQTLTYGQLNARANQLARHLRKLGVGPDVLVGICLERSLDMLVGLLGILKAGGAYVPLDPSFPTERLEFMLADSQVPVLLTQERLLAELPRTTARVFCLDRDWPKLATEAGDNLEPAGNGQSLAYVIYTSGSTGRPKGVMISHRAISNFVTSVGQSPGFSSQDTILAVTTLSFDIAGLELFLPLVAGARIVIASRQVAADGKLLLELLRRSHATIMQATPATWRMMLEAGWKRGTLRKILCGGEALTEDLAANLLERTGEVWNMYGPTETTVWSLIAKIEPRQPIRIGRPIANTQIYILDAQMQPVPIGMPGELHIGGEGLARGYLNRSELTSEKFVPSPFSSGTNARLYKTGDLCRFLADGGIEYLGRIDFQVKVRGFRIELGEIESVLSRHAAVRQAVVTVREDTPGDKRIIAYLLPVAGASPPADELRTLASDALPYYMVPSAFVVLASLPLTPNGKIDRKALPAPVREAAVNRDSFAAPRDMLEQQLANIWEKTLGIPLVSIRDNFFELGGHSLLAVRLFADIERITGKRLPLVTLFQAPTIELLAGILRNEGWQPRWTSLVPIQPSGSKPPLYVVHGIGGNILEFMHLADHIGTDQPFYGLQAQGLDGKNPRHNSVEEMAAHYIKEIREFQPNGPYYLAGSSFGGLVAFEMARLLHAEGIPVGLLVLFDSCSPNYPQYLPTTTALRRWFDEQLFRIDLHWSNFKSVQGPERIEYLRTKLRRLKKHYKHWKNRWAGRISKITQRAYLPKEILAVQNSGWAAQAEFQPKPYLGRVTLFRAATQPPNIYEDSTNGWKNLALGGIDIHTIPGHHGSIVREPRVRVLAQRLRECLAQAHAAQAKLPPPPRHNQRL
ncbi:MAG: amino acid adenylation domain-containing protein [Verrucomicrobia bacterium]|nr:amino acid adenylation domain-containing protein [Verrucomicrobiota bacterium]